MRKVMLSAALVAMSLTATSPALSKPHGNGHDNGRHEGWYKHHGDNDDWREANRYDYNRPDPRFGSYDASRYYRQGDYSERPLARTDRIYRGNDGRYYCRRGDGTTGLIVGGLLGGVLGNTLAHGRSTTLATLLGAGGGALLGKSIDRGNVRCR